MDAKVKQAIEAGVKQYASVKQVESDDLLKSIESVFDLESSFMVKVQKMDVILDDNPEFEEIREVVFDLLLINFFASDVQKLEEDYLESKEWEQIEEDTLDRGTELLNVFLYLNECSDEDIEPELDDYLKEFLLVEEDEFQDEYNIYEKVIANQILVESDYPEIAKVSRSINENDALFELFYPLVSFFYEPDPSPEQIGVFQEYASNKPFETFLYKAIVEFNK